MDDLLVAERHILQGEREALAKARRDVEEQAQIMRERAKIFDEKLPIEQQRLKQIADDAARQKVTRVPFINVLRLTHHIIRLCKLHFFVAVCFYFIKSTCFLLHRRQKQRQLVIRLATLYAYTILGYYEYTRVSIIIYFKHYVNQKMSIFKLSVLKHDTR